MNKRQELHSRAGARGYVPSRVVLWGIGLAALVPVFGATQSPAARTASAAIRPGRGRCAATVKIGVPPAAGTGLQLRASLARRGCIMLYAVGASIAPVEFTESVGSRQRPLGNAAPREGVAPLAAYVPWHCTDRRRVFRAREQVGEEIQSGELVVSTPSCAHRLSVRLLHPPSLHFGMAIRLRVHDGWRLGGIRVRVCSAGRARWRCTRVRIAPGLVDSVVKVRLASSGRVPITLESTAQRVRFHVHVWRKRPVVLATGDSEMELLDNFIGERLRGRHGARVIGDAKHSTALTSPFYLNWFAHASAQVAQSHPDIVAMFLGGNEGFSIGAVECCGAAWARRYAGLVQRMIRTYVQHGRATVYWFLVPTPGREPFIKVVNAVDAGIVAAVRRFPERAHVFDLRPRFSPDGQYVASVHEPDAFHLNTGADQIVARMFVARLRRDGLLAP